MLVMVLIADVVLAMVLIENALTLLLMIEHQPERKLTTAMAMVTPKQQSNTVLGVAVEREPAITITTCAMALGRQQGARPCWTSGAIQ